MVEYLDATARRAHILAKSTHTNGLCEWSVCWVTGCERDVIYIAWLSGEKLHKEALSRRSIRELQYMN